MGIKQQVQVFDDDVIYCACFSGAIDDCDQDGERAGYFTREDCEGNGVDPEQYATDIERQGEEVLDEVLEVPIDLTKVVSTLGSALEYVELNTDGSERSLSEQELVHALREAITMMRAVGVNAYTAKQ